MSMTEESGDIGAPESAAVDSAAVDSAVSASAMSDRAAADSAASAHSTPLYSAFVAYLRQQNFHPGEHIGSERSLAEQFCVTRNQLRLVIEILESRNIVQRQLGRNGGLFMADQLIQRHLNTILGVPEMVRRQGLLLKTVVLNVSTGVAQADERRALALENRAKVIRVQRLRVVEGIPWSLDHSVLPFERFAGLDSAELSGSLYELLHDHYDVDIDWADETLSVVTASTAEAQLLSIPNGHGVLSIWRTTYEESGKPFEFAHDLFRTDRTRLQMQKFGTNWKRTVRRTNGHPASRRTLA